MARKKIIIGNWKMNPGTMKDAEQLFKKIVKSVNRTKKTEIIICAPFIYLDELNKIQTSKVKLGAQDAFWDEAGPYTGEISSDMLYNLGVRYVILGHSERRSLGETNTLVNKKIKGALASGLVPILCVGENTRDASHAYFNMVKEQVVECLQGISKNSISKVIIAYEPVWALSSTLPRKDATALDAQEMAIFIRKILSDKFGSEAGRIRIIYGGSANEKDAGDFLKNGGIDGLLPGRASLDALKFVEIINIAENFTE
ncbi:MAG: triose-phosphate isomerase [Patescibacteria group bacterium]